jgi:hypothetical protein
VFGPRRPGSRARGVIDSFDRLRVGLEIDLARRQTDQRAEVVEPGQPLDLLLVRLLRQIPVARVFTLVAGIAPELTPVKVEIPAISRLEQHSALLFTRIQVYAQYRLLPYEAEITLPRPCPEMMPLQAGANYQLSYQLGSYPGFELRAL